VSARLAREDWLALGLERLADDGPPALQLERVCAAAGRTRGSFYHHFVDHADFLDALAAHWRKRHTEALIDLSQEGSPTVRLRTIRLLATRVDAAVELGMRRLAAGNPRIQAVVDEVDRRRIDYMTRLHQARPGATRNQAAAFAWLEYAAYIGSQILWPDADPEELARTGDLLSDCLATITAGEPAADGS
jgi:AcrR family transcriptional regulator